MTYASWFKCIVGNTGIWKPWLKFVLTESSTEPGKAHTIPARRSARLSKLGSLSTKTSSSDIRQNVSPKHKTRQTSKQKQKVKAIQIKTTNIIRKKTAIKHKTRSHYTDTQHKLKMTNEQNGIQNNSNGWHGKRHQTYCNSWSQLKLVC